MNRFGDLILILPDGTIHKLDVGGGSIAKVAENQDGFCKKIDEEDANDWRMIPLVNRLVARGVDLLAGQCYSFLIPPALGGEYTVENTVVLSVGEHYGLYGSYHDQWRSAADGMQVIIRVKSDKK